VSEEVEELDPVALGPVAGETFDRRPAALERALVEKAEGSLAGSDDLFAEYLVHPLVEIARMHVDIVVWVHAFEVLQPPDLTGAPVEQMEMAEALLVRCYGLIIEHQPRGPRPGHRRIPQSRDGGETWQPTIDVDAEAWWHRVAEGPASLGSRGRRVTPAGEATCEEVATVLQAYEFGRLGPADASRVRGHLWACADCRSIVDEIDRDTAHFLQATALDELPEDLLDLIIEAAAEAAQTPGGGR